MLPALLIGYNRPSHTARVVQSLCDAGVRSLFVSLDGARLGDETECSQTRSFIENLTWPVQLEVRLPERNEGPGWGPRNAISWFFSRVPVGIICEDDTVFAPDAARFLTQVSEDFRPRIPMASATSLGASAYVGASAYFASRYATTWGWATTAEAWSAYDYTMREWPELRSSNWLRNVGGSKAFSDYWTNIFDMTYADRDHYWDYQWQFAMWRRGWLSWHPRVNLVSNIGFDEAATHTRDQHRGLTRLPTGDLAFPLAAPASEEPVGRVDTWIDRNVYRTRRSWKGRLYRAVLKRSE